MPDIIITPSTGKLEFVDNSAQTIRRHSFTLDHSDGLVLDAPLSAAAISAPLNVINVTVNNSNANYPFVLAQSGETGAKNLLMDGAGGTYNPFTNTATIDISGNSATTTLASNSTNLGGVDAASYVTLTGTQTLTNKTITGTFTGNLTGTGSWATNAVSAISATTATNSTQLNGQAASYYTNIPARLGYTPVNQAGDTISGNLTVNGNFTVNGSVTAFSASNIYLSSSVLTVEDNILTLNAFSPYLRYAGIEMYDSGSGTLSQLLWDGEGDYFFLTGSNVNGKIITGPDGQTNLTSGYIPKATAGYKLGNSLIYDNGTNVGIGTTNPTQKLEVAGYVMAGEGLYRTNIYGSNGGAWIGFGDTGSLNSLGRIGAYGALFNINSLNNDISFQYNSAEKMRITTGGHLGLGITNPAAYVNSNGNWFRPSLDGLYSSIYATTEAVVNLISSGSADGAAVGGVYFTRARAQGDAHYQIAAIKAFQAGTSNTIAGGTLYFYTKNNNGGTAAIEPAMVIGPGGNVGIGTTGPNTKLHIYGSGGGFEFGVGSPNCFIETIDRASVGKDLNTGFYTRGSGSFTWHNGSYTERMRIDGNGNVGVGTTAPATTLHVVGVISGSSFSGAGTGLTGTAAGLSIGGNAATATTAANVNNGTLTISTGTGIGIGTTTTFTANQSGNSTITLSNTGVTAITTNTGLSTNASATGAVTITNTGVTSNVAGTGISVSGATGAVTITNSGVTSAVAGTGVSVSGATGAITFSIGQAVGTGNSPTFAAVTTSTDGANHIMAGTTNAEGIRMTPASSTTYPVFLRSINPGVGEASPWIYKEQATDWGIWHNNPVNSIDFTKQGSVGISTNVGGSSTNAVTVRVEMATGFVQTIAGYRNSAGTTILDNNGNITGNAATATILQTARNIGGVSFNGSADINLPGVNTAGNQNTSGNAATATTATNANAVSFTEVELNAPVTVSGTWTSGNGSEWGEPKFGTSFNQFRYTDGNGPYVEYNIPANHHACFISQLQWDTGGYADCHGVQSDGDLVFLRRINTRQLVENSNHGNTIQHDGATVSFVGSGLQAFTKIRITNRSGRIHMTGIAFTRQIDDGYEGTGMVHPAQISHQGSGSGLDADLLDGYNSATANTVNTIVLRDASGNFSAGTITATLSGTATTANALNTSNSYTGVNFLATGFLQSNSGNIKSDTPFALLTTSNGAQALSTRGILLGTSYDTTPGANEIRTTNNTSLYLNARGTGDIQFQTADSLKMMLLNNGNVGIGTSNPGRKLDVEGIVRTRGASGTGGFEISAASSGTAKWRIEWDSASDSLDFNWVG